MDRRAPVCDPHFWVRGAWRVAFWFSCGACALACVAGRECGCGCVLAGCVSVGVPLRVWVSFACPRALFEREIR